MNAAADATLVVLMLGMILLLGVIIGAGPTSRRAGAAVTAYTAMIALSGCVRRDVWQIVVGAACFAASLFALPLLNRWVERVAALRRATRERRARGVAALAPDEPCRCEFCRLPESAKAAERAAYLAEMRSLGFPTEPEDVSDVRALLPLVSISRRAFVAGLRWARENPEQTS